jgi:hypothetical protein
MNRLWNWLGWKWHRFAQAIVGEDIWKATAKVIVRKGTAHQLDVQIDYNDPASVEAGLDEIERRLKED